MNLIKNKKLWIQFNKFNHSYRALGLYWVGRWRMLSINLWSHELVFILKRSG